MSERRRVSANILWLLGERMLRLGVSFGIIGLLARHLGPEGFGTLNYAIGLAVLFTALATLGLDTVVVRELVRSPAQTDAILGTAFVLRLVGAIVAIIALGLCAPWLVAGTHALLPLVAITSLALVWQAFEVIDLWFQKHLQSRHTVVAKLAALIISSAVKLVLIARAAPLAWFCWAFVLDGLLYAAALVLVYRQQGGRLGSWNFSRPLARTLLHTAWPLITAGLLISFYLRLDQILVLRLLGARELGFYTAASKVAEIWIAVSAFVLTSVFPLLAARHVLGTERFLRDLQFAFDVMTGLGYIIAVSVTLAAPTLIPLVFGENYRPAGRVLAVLAWSAPFIFSGGIRAHYFMLEGTTIYHNWSALLGIAANAALAYWLLPWLGAPGAAAAVVVSSALSAWVSSYIFPRLRDCGRLQTIALLLPVRPRTWPDLFRRLTRP
ncbi:MAG: flippase [Opitutaceae bacterium]